MSNSCTLHTGQSTDGRPTIGTTQRPLTESLYTVPIELDGGTMLITTTINVPHTTERLPLPDFTMVFDEAKLPTWVDALFGEDVADIFFETLTVPSPQPRTIPLTLSDLATDHLRAMARYAEGLWIRRYWPATREIPIEDEDESSPQTHTDLGYEAIPATSTFLTDLELVALAADSFLRPLLGNSPSLLPSPVSDSTTPHSSLTHASVLLRDIAPSSWKSSADSSTSRPTRNTTLASKIPPHWQSPLKHSTHLMRNWRRTNSSRARPQTSSTSSPSSSAVPRHR